MQVISYISRKNFILLDMCFPIFQQKYSMMMNNIM